LTSYNALGESITFIDLANVASVVRVIRSLDLPVVNIATHSGVALDSFHNVADV